MACAEPVVQARIGPRAFVVGIDSRLHATAYPFSSPAVGRARCVDALPLETEGAQRVLFCAWRQKSASGQWPGSLAELAAAWPGCVPKSAGKLWYSTPEQSLGYFRGLRGAELAVVSRHLRQGRYADSNGRAFAFDSELPPLAPTGPRAGAEPDRPAPDSLEAGCAANDARACWALGEDTFDGYRGRAKDRTLGREILNKACQLGSGRACYELGSRGRDDPPEGTILGSEEQLRRTRRSLTDYERACELGDGAGCAEAGRILARGKSIPADVLERLADRARLSRTRFEPPPPILQDAARSQMLLGKACDLGREEGCLELARSGADPTRVEAPCARGDGESCLILARGLTVAGTQEGLARARDLFLLACDFGFSGACLDAARLTPDAAPELLTRAAALSR
jgi:TPR repeat protein